MNTAKAKEFVMHQARELDLAVARYFFEQGPRQDIVQKLLAYQNPDGGFGHGLEPDYLNPNSTPIATNDAIITLFRTGSLNENTAVIEGIIRYLKSHDSFDEEKKHWLFAISSNKSYPMQYGGRKRMTVSAVSIRRCRWRHFSSAMAEEMTIMRKSWQKDMNI